MVDGMAFYQVHLRSAKKLLKLCEANGGFYVKAGQFVSSLRQVPKEYTSTLSCLQDKVCASMHILYLILFFLFSIFIFMVLVVLKLLRLLIHVFCILIQATPYNFQEIKMVIEKNLGSNLSAL